MNSKLRLAAATLAAITWGSTTELSGATLNVPSAAYPTIQAAINAAANGDTVAVGPGLYIEPVSFIGKGITVRGTQGPEVTVIQAPTPDFNVVSFVSGEPSTALLEGFTLRRGNFGVNMITTSPTIRSNIIAENRMGVLIRSSSPLVQGNTIVSNTVNGGIFIQGAANAQIIGNNISHNIDTSSGGGAAIEMFTAGLPVIRNNLISFNSATSGGGVLTMVNFSDALIEQNLIIRNNAGNNGTITWLAPSSVAGARVINNTIAYNTSSVAAGIAADGLDTGAQIINNIIYAEGSQTGIWVGSSNDLNLPQIRTNLVISETGARYSGIATDQTGMNGNIGVDPLFADAANNDFRLSPGSPAIDVALASRAPASDFVGLARPVDGNGDGIAAPDLGVYEFLGMNLPPVAEAKTLQVEEDSSGTVQLSGTDQDGDPLTFRLTSNPAHGEVTVDGNSVLYTPAANYSGPDSFTYVANDSQDDSEPATVSITVSPVNDPPTATGAAYTLAEDSTQAILLVAHDPDSGLVYEISVPPQHGTLSGTAPHLVYTPGVNFNGADSFEFAARDLAAAASAVVSITVTPVNDPPTANAMALEVPEDGSVTVSLSGSDVDGDSLVFRVVTQPQNGSLSLVQNELVYTPNAGFNGGDQFTFVANDGSADSAAAAVLLTVRSENDPPTANSASYSTEEDKPVTFTLTGTDADGDALTSRIVTPPGHGSLSVNGNTVQYSPAPNFNGTDQLTFVMSDGTSESVPATIAITITPVNDAPIAVSETVFLLEDQQRAVTVSGTDVDGDALTFSLKEAPAHGTLSGTSPNFVYTPAPNFNGRDSFRFYVHDGKATSHGTITLKVTPVNDAPVAEPQSITLLEDSTAEITLNGSDLDGDALTYSVVNAPTRGTLSGVAPNIVYTPAANFFGTDTFAYVANDGKANSEPVTVTITVTPVNDAPSFTLNGTTVLAKKNAGLETHPGWLQNLSAGPNEAQNVSIAISNNNPGLFDEQPAISANGTLTFNPRQGRTGSAIVTIKATDNGGTANGGLDQSTQTFTIGVDMQVATTITISSRLRILSKQSLEQNRRR